MIVSTPVQPGCRTILIVEDNADCRELQACVIRRLGYVVIEVDNGLSAIDEALTTHPDLILMDLSMPKMDGDEATVQVKAQPCTRDIPVIICTASGPGAKVNRALDAGAAEILYKPFTFFDRSLADPRKHIHFEPPQDTVAMARSRPAR